MTTCRFCQIIEGQRDAHVIHEGDHSVAFLDRNPIAEGHILLVPREHTEGIDAMDDPTITELFTTARSLTDALSLALDAEGFSLFHTTGPLIGTIEHAHVHLVPRYRDDTIHISLPRAELDGDRGERLTREITRALEQFD